MDEPRDLRTYAIIGAAMAVHRELGPGFLEAVYQDALAIEFGKRGVPHEREVAVPVFYDGHRLDRTYRADFLCFGGVVVETKAIAFLGRPAVAQLAHYLTATRIPLGLLINFGSTSLQFQRVVSRFASQSPSCRYGDGQVAN